MNNGSNPGHGSIFLTLMLTIALIDLLIMIFKLVKQIVIKGEVLDYNADFGIGQVFNISIREKN